MIRTAWAQTTTLAAVLALTTQSAVPAQAPSPATDPEAVAAQELVVTAKVTGPAWWRVTKGVSEVWVLGVPPALPKGFAWDSRALDRHLSGARLMITPATARAGLTDIPALLRIRGQMKLKTSLRDSLSPQLSTRLTADARSLGEDPGRYDHWNGLYAGISLAHDFHLATRLDEGQPMAAINRAARAHGVKARPAVIYEAVKFLKDGAAGLTPQIEQACLVDALDEIESGAARQTQAAIGWNRGDIPLALTAAPGIGHCLNRLTDGAQISRRVMADEAGAIATALDTPGTSVAIVPLRPLLAQGGVLQQLEARGYEIRTPDR